MAELPKLNMLHEALGTMDSRYNEDEEEPVYCEDDDELFPYQPNLFTRTFPSTTHSSSRPH